MVVIMENPFEDQKKSLSKLGKVFKLGIHSGKGGVGKTFLSVNIAYSLAKEGFRVGLLDADIDCPNVSKFLAIKDLIVKDSSNIKPVYHNGVKIVSTALLNPSGSETPIIIRGPIKHNMLISFLSSVDWGELDFLIIDLPPGTADVPLSAMQLSALDALVFVTTPTKEAILDTARACNMAKKLQIRIIGLVENMTGDIFGSHGKEASERLGIPFLGSIPLTKQTALISEQGGIAFLENASLSSIRSELITKIRSAAAI
jgi:ATP-binding protein involved in chromosome partitioning